MELSLEKFCKCSYCPSSHDDLQVNQDFKNLSYKNPINIHYQGPSKSSP